MLNKNVKNLKLVRSFSGLQLNQEKGNFLLISKFLFC